MRIPLDEIRTINKDVNHQVAMYTRPAPAPARESVSEVAGVFPFPRDTIKGWIQEKVFAVTGQWIDPDKVYLHQFSTAHSTQSGSSATRWQHSGTPEKSMTLTDAVASDFFSAERYGTAGKAQAAAHFLSSNVSPFTIFHSESVSDFFSRLGQLIIDRTGPGYIYSKIHEDVPEAQERWRDLDAVYGLYLDGPEKGVYNADNELRLKPSALLNIVREGDLQKKVMGKLDSFWGQHTPQWRALAKEQFIKEANAARALNQANPAEGLSQEEFRWVMKAAASNVPLEGAATQEQLLALAAPAADEKVFRFDINGYGSSDILRFVLRDGSEVLYVPGAAPALHRFKDRAALNQWVVEQGKDPDKAAALAQHFSLRDRQQGVFGKLSVNGVDSALKKMGAGVMAADSSHINNQNYPIADDVFSAMARQTRQRIESDADTEIKSNAEVHKDNALGMLQAGNAVFSIPLALLGPIGLGIGAASFGAQVGMEVDKAIEGDTQAERQEGLHGAVMDVATLAFFHALGKAGSSAGTTDVQAQANPPEGAGTTAAKPFFNYRRVNGQIGVLMSPMWSGLSESQGRGLNPLWDPTMEVYLPRAGNPPAAQPRYETEQPPAEKRMRLDESRADSPVPAQSPGSVASDATSSGEYERYDDDTVIKTNPFQASVKLPDGGHFNSRGMIERTDLPKLYRVEKADRVDRRGDPQDIGFRDSNFFSGPEKMLDGDVLIASRSKEAAMHFGDTEFGGEYYLYEIDSEGVPTVSLNENIDLNPQFTEARQSLAAGTIDRLRQAGRLKEFAANAYQFDEVHVSNDLLSNTRIFKIPHR